MLKEGYEPGTVNRTKLLETFTARNVSSSTAEKLTRPMRGKSPEEKERMAAEILERFLAENPS